MPPAIPDLNQAVRDILTHVEALPPEADSPIRHYLLVGIDMDALLLAVEEGFKLVASPDAAAVAKNNARLHAMVLVNLVEAFERYLKEVAAACIDFLGAFVLDGRFDTFRVTGSTIAAFFGTGSLGRALCESATWLDTTTINARFKAILADPFEKGDFFLFPDGKNDTADRGRFETLELLWQLRHTVVHNVGVITKSDAVKFRLLVKAEVPSPRLMVPTREDMRYLKRFLNETTELANGRVAARLADVLSSLHAENATLFVPQAVADQVAATFGVPVTLAGAAGNPPPP